MEETLASYYLATIKKHNIKYDTVYEIKKMMKNLDGAAILQKIGNELGVNESPESNVHGFIDSTIKTLIRYIRNIENTLGYEGLSNSITIDSVGTESPNAFVIHVKEDNSYAIGFDFSLIPIFEQILLAGMYYSNEFKKRKLGEKAKQQLLSTIQDIFTIFFKRQHVDNYEKRLLSMLKSTKHLHQLIALIRMNAVGFVILHELGHIALDHFNKTQAICLSLLTGSDAEISTFNHKREYEADKWAFDAQTSYEKDALVRSYVSVVPSIYFSISSIIENMHQPRSVVGKHISITHPTADKRSQRLLKLCKGLSDRQKDQSVEYYENLISFFLRFAQLLKVP
jgi:hypothetical protein